MVKSPTHYTDTTEAILDLFLTNNATLVNKVEVIPGISDHEAVYIESSLRPDKIKKLPRKVLQYNKMNKPEMIKKLQETKIEMNNDHQNMTVDEVWDIFKKKVLDAVDQTVPSKMINNNKKKLPWITKEIKALIRKRNKLYQKKKRNKCTRTTKKYHECKQTLQKKMRQEYWKYLEGIISFDTTDTNSERPQKQKSSGATFKNMKKDNTGVAPLRNNGLLINDSKQKAEVLNTQYHSVFTPEDDTPISASLEDNYPSMPEINVTNNGVEKFLKNIDASKATGPDEISARILKEFAPELSPLLTSIFNKSIQEGDVPTDWRQANVIPVFKKGEIYLASNYRPVSLTCICCKILEHIVVTSILSQLDAHKILVDCQHGFRDKRSCEIQLLTISHELVENLHKGIQTDLIILDFSKAFDKVPHSKLLMKMENYGIRGNTW